MKPGRIKKGKPVFDRSIWITLGVVSMIGLFITGYKYFTFSDCSTVNFVVKGDNLTIGKIVSFKDITPGASQWKWNFGDESEAATNKEALHVFKQPGKYWVTLRVNEGCTVRKKITIQKREKIVNSSRYPTFSMPTTANVGNRVRFTDHTDGAQKWKWSFGESMQIDATSKNPSYVFKSAGTKTVTLIVDGKDRFATKKRITIFARPVKKPGLDLEPHEKIKIKKVEPEDTVHISTIPIAPPLKPKQEKKVPEINRIQLEDYLLQVSEESRKPETLRPFFCKGYDTRVRINGEEDTLQFLLQYLQGKKVSIENLEVIKNKKTRCIDYIKIDYKKNKLFGIF